MTRPARRHSSLVVQCATYLAFGMPIGMLGAGWPEARGLFDASTSSLGIVGAAYGIGRLSTSPFALPILRRWSMRRASVTFGAGLAASCVVVGVTRSFAVLVVAMAVLGALTGCLDSLGHRYQSVVRSVASAGLMFGAYGVGSTLGPAIVALSSWTVGYLVSAALVAFGAVLALSSQVRWPAELRQPEPPHQPGGAVHVPRSVLALSLSLFAIYCGIEVVTANWAASYLEAGRGVSGTTAAWAMSGFWAGMTLGRLSMGRLAAGGSGLSPARITIGSGTGLLVVFAAVPIVPPMVAVVLFSLAGLALAGIFPTLQSTTADRVGVAAAGRVAGWQLLTANVSATAFSAAVGVAVSRAGAGVPGTVLVAMAVVGLPLLIRSTKVHVDEHAPLEVAVADPPRS